MNKPFLKSALVRLTGVLALSMIVLSAAADLKKVISINVLGMEIAEVMAMLATKEQINILVNNGVEGEISLNLYEVTVKDAIEAAARAGGFAVERIGDTFYIVKPDDVGSRYKSNLTTVKTFNIRYSDPQKVKAIIEEYLSDYGVISVLEDRSILVVEDTPEHISRVSTILKRIDETPRQILIEAKILEITLSDNNAYGINWTKVFSEGSTTIGVQGLASPATGLFIDRLTDNFEATLQALYSKSDVRTLSSPNLVTRENTEASVIIGDRQGYRVTTTINQVTTESIEFLESGVILRVLPTVDEFGNIIMQVHPEVSTGFISTDGVPSQQTTEVTTEILTKDGQPIFIGGLIKNNVTDGKSGVPLVSKIPLIGALFSSRSRASNNTETVVLISPYIVGGEAHQMMLEKAARVEQQQGLLSAELERIGSEFDKKAASDPAAVRPETYDNDWDDPAQDDDLWGDESYF